MTEINDWNGAFIPDDEADCCQTCNGRGGNTSTQDPVGDGVGFETLFDACPDCIGQDKCPGCMSAFDSAKWECLAGCGWEYESDNYSDYEPSMSDYRGEDDFPF